MNSHRTIVKNGDHWHVVTGGDKEHCDACSCHLKNESKVIEASELPIYLNFGGLTRALHLIERAGEHFDEGLTVAQAYSAIRQAILAERALV